MLTYLLELLVVAVGSIVQGAVGFGYALVSAPLLVLIDPNLVPAPATVGAAAVGVLNAYRNRRPVDYRGIGWASVGVVPGTILAGVVLAQASAGSLAVLVGILVLLAVAVSLAGLQVSRSPKVMASAGAISGFMGTTATIGGPPIALVYQRESGPYIRSTLARFFLVATAFAVVAQVWSGRLGVDELWAGLALYPGILAGFLLSRPLLPVLDAGWTRGAVLTVAAGSSLVVLLRELLS